MDDITIRRSEDHPGVEAERLAALVGSRLCHDLVSPLGAIGNGLELLQLSGDFPGIAKSAEMQLVAESVQAARARIRWFRMAFGHAAPDQRIALTELAGLLGDADKAGRIRVRLDAPGDLPRTEARMILLAFMCLETAMPWGGSVLICRGARGWRLVAESSRVKSDPALWAWLDRAAAAPRALTEPAPSEVQFALLAAFARQANRPLAWELDETGGEISF
ncbi:MULTISPECIES: histidine phosphotransferase family protein [Paracoccus]|uniref:Histidine phosphotransferase n=3 Tax=Paracoccus TaxID=265 RepID=A0A2D2C4M5_9RHOB|nr:MULTISPECIES: histidine phosphotransferase family protein [Paracoccus]ATQ57455.1 histidine phosphotransferase [Paracoccus yeei]AWX92488.1 histidine phosphotransferase [Paracoccus mutanolyticus]AYF01661.1 histidine phosphotransferase [Paracoccus yeei]MBY0136638.1 histidine phosphotransferase [Paracoccus yeei]OWJ94378.1 histidine phosphotransferase [Paracoccus yeei]